MIVITFFMYVFLYLILGFALGAILSATVEESDNLQMVLGTSEDTQLARLIILGIVWPLVVAVLILWGVYLLVVRGLPWLFKNALGK